MRRTLKLVSALTIGLVGCGGGSGGGGDNDPPPPPPPPTQSAAGIWQGSLSSGGTLVNEISCAVTVANELACLFFDPVTGDLAGGSQGTLQVDGNQVTGSGRSYAAPGYFLADGSSVVANFTITGGTVSERSTINATITSLGQTASLTAAFDTIYDRGSSLGTVAASYSTLNIYGDPASFSIDSTGALFSQTQSGCVGNGEVRIIDSRFNVYDVEVDVSNCPGLNGNYDGLAVTTDFAATNDVFLFGVFNSSGGIVAASVK